MEHLRAHVKKAAIVILSVVAFFALANTPAASADPAPFVSCNVVAAYYAVPNTAWEDPYYAIADDGSISYYANEYPSSFMAVPSMQVSCVFSGVTDLQGWRLAQNVDWNRTWILPVPGYMETSRATCDLRFSAGQIGYDTSGHYWAGSVQANSGCHDQVENFELSSGRTVGQAIRDGQGNEIYASFTYLPGGEISSCAPTHCTNPTAHQPQPPAPPEGSGIPPYSAPDHCVIEAVFGDQSKTQPKQRDLDYTYVVTFHGPAVELTFDSESTENAHDGPTAAMPPSTPPLLQQSPWTFTVRYPEDRVYAGSIRCTDPTGVTTIFTFGDESIAAKNFGSQINDCITGQNWTGNGWDLGPFHVPNPGAVPVSMLKAAGCMLSVIFVPQVPMITYWHRLQDAAHGTVFEATTGVIEAVFGAPGAFADAAGSGNCRGPMVRIDLDGGGDVYPLDACSSPAKDWATFTRTVLRGATALMCALALANLLQSVWGGPRINNDSVERYEQGRFVL